MGRGQSPILFATYGDFLVQGLIPRAKIDIKVGGNIVVSQTAVFP